MGKTWKDRKDIARTKKNNDQRTKARIDTKSKYKEAQRLKHKMQLEQLEQLES